MSRNASTNSKLLWSHFHTVTCNSSHLYDAKRLKRYIDETKGKIVFGGQADVEKKYVAPTVVKDVPLDDALMEEYV